ncbi:uncharacterized protein ACA1_069340 [Acanthamoeba castellanii str. Neff]|uniref:Frizzled/Smoothened family membrane region protein n=1 Tax=Acanthamoeba castellanii (strain ATCC 30010 / Neff) TaxID=1257118 RepID=L8HDT2_ACACF|nr:uncharacterized protein ACA1_069340 [Acanthamoeba castellanii str. Neff]ELR23350.1 hypothetical protein ACA1_069340 [Acanthamoeba castellanii str. Neff]
MAMTVAIIVALLVGCCVDVATSDALTQEERAYSVACVPYTGSPATAGKYPNTYASVDKRAANQTAVMGAFFPPECRSPLVALTCMGSFLRCQFNSNFPLFDVYPPCRSVCEAVVLGCTAFFESQGMKKMLPDCDMIDNSTGTPFPAFPPDGTQCVAMPPDMFVPYGEADCPYPLKFNYDDQDSFTASSYDPTQMCVMPCPNPMWSDAEWTAGVTLTLVVNGTSGILSLFIAISMCLMPGKRRFPGTLFIYIASCLAVLSFIVTFFPIISGGVTRMACTRGNPPLEVTFDNAREYDGAGVPCILQGVGILYFALVSSLWWLALCLSVFDMVYLRRSVHLIRKWHIPYHFIAWGLPFCAVIAGFAGTAYGAVPGIPWCFLRDSEWWSWGLFYFPVAIFLIIGTIAMTFSVYRFIKVAISMSVRFRFLGRSGESIEQVVRLLLLLLVYWMVLIYPWGFRIYSRVIEDDIADAFEKQIRCSAATGTQCELEERLNIGAWYLVQIAFGAGGFAMFMCCCSSEVLRLWWNINKIIFTHSFRDSLVEIRWQ